VSGIDGLYLATAFSGSGFKIAPAVGTCLAELITEGARAPSTSRRFVRSGSRRGGPSRACTPTRHAAITSSRDNDMGGPEMAPHTPQRSGRPGEAVAPLDTPISS